MQPASDRRGETPCQVPLDQVRAFFRRLGEPQQLAKDTIARACLENVADRGGVELAGEQLARRIRTIVLDLANRYRLWDVERVGRERAERRYAAIVRGDLEREPAKQIAADLGISMRQLRRERSYARSRIVSAIVERPVCAVAEALPDAVSLELDLARRLADSGRAAAAIQILQSLADAPISSDRQIEILTTMFEIFVDCDLHDRAAMTIEAIQDRRVPDASYERYGGKRSKAEMLGVVGGMLHARQAFQEEGEVPASVWANARRDPAMAAIASVMLVGRARRALAKGSWAAARAEIYEVGALIASARVGLSTRVDSLILESHILLACESDFSRARTAAAYAVEIAQKEGLERRAAVAGRHLALAQFLMGDHAAAASTSRAALEVARRAGDGDVLASATLNIANIELMRRRVTTALPHLQSAAAFVAEGSIYWSQIAPKVDRRTPSARRSTDCFGARPLSTANRRGAGQRSVPRGRASTMCPTGIRPWKSERGGPNDPARTRPPRAARNATRTKTGTKGVLADRRGTR